MRHPPGGLNPPRISKSFTAFPRSSTLHAPQSCLQVAFLQLCDQQKPQYDNLKRTQRRLAQQLHLLKLATRCITPAQEPDRCHRHSVSRRHAGRRLQTRRHRRRPKDRSRCNTRKSTSTTRRMEQFLHKVLPLQTHPIEHGIPPSSLGTRLENCYQCYSSRRR